MKFMCRIDTIYHGIRVKANKTVIDADADAFVGNSYWYPLEKQDAVKTPVRPRISRIKK